MPRSRSKSHPESRRRRTVLRQIDALPTSEIAAVRPILSVDTAYDVPSQWFAHARSKVYEDLAGHYSILQLVAANASRQRMLDRLSFAESNGKPFRALLVSSHGTPGSVSDDHDSPGGVLFSVQDSPETLRLLGRGRFVYLCCCETAKGPLGDRFLDEGCMAFIGYTGTPSWTSDEGRKIWRDFDIEIVKSIVYGQGAGALVLIRDHFLDRINVTLPYAIPTFAKDLKNMADVLTTMVVRE
jgi:hypothetical protein